MVLLKVDDPEMTGPSSDAVYGPWADADAEVGMMGVKHFVKCRGSATLGLYGSFV